MRAWVSILVTAAAIAALQAAGCGGDEAPSRDGGASDDAADVAALSGRVGSEDAFIAQADMLCSRTSAIVHDGLQPYMEQGLEAVETRAVAGGMVRDIVAPDLETLAVAIGALDWPAGAEAEVGAFLTALEEVAENGREDPVELILHHKRAMAGAERLAEAYGFSNCGRLRIVLPDEDEEAESEGDSKEEFIERADSLCRRATAIVLAELQPYIKRGAKAVRRPSTVQKIADDVVALELEAEFGALSNLEWPAGDDGEIGAFLAAIEDVIDRSRERPAELIFHTRHAFKSARRLAEAYGFSYCGRVWIVLPNSNSEAHLG